MILSEFRMYMKLTWNFRKFRLWFLCLFILFRAFNIDCYSDTSTNPSNFSEIESRTEKLDVQHTVDMVKEEVPGFVKYAIKDGIDDEVVIVVDEKATNKPYTINFSPVIKIKQHGNNNRIILGKYDANSLAKMDTKELEINKIDTNIVAIPEEKKVKVQTLNNMRKNKKKGKIIKTTNQKPKKFIRNKIKKREQNIVNKKNHEDEEIEIVENYFGTEEEIKDMKKKQESNAQQAVVTK